MLLFVSRWEQDPAVVNAFYNPNMNDIGRKGLTGTIQKLQSLLAVHRQLCAHNFNMSKSIVNYIDGSCFIG